MTTQPKADTNNRVQTSLILTQDNVTANTNFTLPASSIIDYFIINNTTANAVTGGINIGTTAGGSDVVSGFAVGANFNGHIPDASINNRVFSGPQKLYISAGSSWNNANLNFQTITRTPS